MHSIDMRDWASASFYLVVVALGTVGVIIMVAPVVVGFLMSLTAGDTIQFPPEGLSLRWYRALFDPAQSSRILSAGLTSLQIAALATAFAILVAVPAALGLAGAEGRRFAFLEPFFMLPLVLPTLVYGSRGADVLRQHRHRTVLLAGGSRSHGRSSRPSSSARRSRSCRS